MSSVWGRWTNMLYPNISIQPVTLLWLNTWRPCQRIILMGNNYWITFIRYIQVTAKLIIWGLRDKHLTYKHLAYKFSLMLQFKQEWWYALVILIIIVLILLYFIPLKTIWKSRYFQLQFISSVVFFLFCIWGINYIRNNSEILNLIEFPR